MYVVVGANGFLGSYVIKNLLQTSEEDILAICRHPHSNSEKRVRWVSADITIEDDVERLNREFLPNSSGCKVIYLAAYHYPDLVEKYPRLAWDINITALSRFLNTIEHVDRLFYSSSESVYGESSDGYHFKESDCLHPSNRYGHHKRIAESLVTGYGYNVVRFPFLIAPSLAEEKQHFYDMIVKNLISGRSVDMFSDSYHSALDYDTASRLLIQLIENRETMPQILNVSGDEDLSKYDIGLRIADRLGVSQKLIRPISINDDNGIFEVRRASSTLLDNSLLKETLGLDSIHISI